VVSLRLGGWTVPWLMVLSAAMFLPFLFAVTKDNWLLNFLGDLTYPIYLIHGTVFTFLFTPFAVQFLAHSDYLGIPSAPLFVGLYFASLLIVGAAVHFSIERPFAAVLRWLTAPAVVGLPSREWSVLSPSAGRPRRALGEGAEV
jgi:peptidoglycan/LPS O-acetylase OafA/YrhL